MLRALLKIGEAEGSRYVAYINNDICLLPSVEGLLCQGAYDAIICARSEMGAEDVAPDWIMRGGYDAFFFRTHWLRSNMHRFRDYIVGEAFWDTAYAGICMLNGVTRIFQMTHYALHLSHPVVWRNSPFSYHNYYLSRRDGVYVGRWCRYFAELTRLLEESELTEEQVYRIQQKHCHAPTLFEGAYQILRSGKAMALYCGRRFVWA